jgi:hypothetical protein
MVTRCRRCGRKLTNPVSIEIGIGPVCRAENNKQGVFDFMHAQFELLRHKRGKYIFIRDIGHKTRRSVTNDADYVVEQLCLIYNISDDTRIIYEDSQGEISELRHTGNNFTGFKAGHKGIEL